MNIVNNYYAVADVAQWIKLQSADRKGCQCTVRALPGFWARSPVDGVRETTDCCFSHTYISLPLFSPSFPLFLKVNKENLKKKKRITSMH